MARITGCRICGNPGIETVLSLGDMPLVNALVKESAPGLAERTNPPELVYCPECSIVQIAETVPPQLFSEYFSHLPAGETVRECARFRSVTNLAFLVRYDLTAGEYKRRGGRFISLHRSWLPFNMAAAEDPDSKELGS